MNKNCIYCKSKNCGKTFILKSNGRNYDEEFKKNAMRLYFEGNSSRTVVEF